MAERHHTLLEDKQRVQVANSGCVFLDLYGLRGKYIIDQRAKGAIIACWILMCAPLGWLDYLLRGSLIRNLLV